MFRIALLASAILGLPAMAMADRIPLQADLTGKSEVPANATAGSGEVKATLDTDSKELTWAVTYQGLTGTATGGHFHGPAAPGANAPVASGWGTALANPVTGKAKLTDAQIKDLLDGKWYANIHTQANPGGEIRGQVMRAKP